MNGKRYLLDTNAIVQLLAGNKELAGIVRGADFLATSVVCQFEFLSYPGLTEPDARLYAKFSSRIHTFSVPADDVSFSDAVVAFRRTKKLKMPDAIIAATAKVNDCALVSADDDFKKAEGLPRLTYSPD